jgi:hypothetical protein
MVRPRRAEQCLPQEDATLKRNAGAPTMRSRHPRRCPIPASQGPSGDALGRAPLRQEPAKADRLQSSVPSGCGKIGRSWRCAPWHRSPSYDQRRALYDHPDFNSNALSEDLFSGSLVKAGRIKNPLLPLSVRLSRPPHVISFSSIHRCR